MNLEVILHNGNVTNMEVETFDAKVLETKANNRDTFLIALGNNTINKNTFALIVPSEQAANPNVEIILNNGLSVKVEDPHYDAQSIEEKANKNEVMVLSIGDAVIAKNMIQQTKLIAD